MVSDEGRRDLLDYLLPQPVRATQQTVTKRFVVIACLICSLIGGAIGAVAFYSLTPSSHGATATASSGTPTAPATSSRPIGDVAAELAPGSAGDDYDRTYQCKTGYTPVQVTVGKVVQRNGATYRLTEQQDEANDQTQVTYDVTLPSTTEVPTLIINTGAHNTEPTLFPQYLIKANLRDGDAATYNFATTAYAPTAGYYAQEGITDITACTKTK